MIAKLFIVNNIWLSELSVLQDGNNVLSYVIPSDAGVYSEWTTVEILRCIRFVLYIFEAIKTVLM